MCDLVASELMNMTVIMDSNTANRKQAVMVAYPAAPEPFPLVDIASVDG
jgi:hypothetical protein